MGADDLRLSGRRRTARLLRNIILIGLGKGGIYAAALLTARLLVEIGGVDAYGLWAPCAQLLMWVGLLDLGFGFALQNLVSHATSDSARLAAGRAAGAVLVVLLVLAVFIIGMGVLAITLEPAALRLLYASTLSPALADPAARSVMIALVGLAISLVAQVPLRLVVGIQGHGTLAAWQGGVALIALAALPAAHAVGLPWTSGLAVAVLLPLLVPLVIGGLLLRRSGAAWAMPRLDHGLRPLRGLLGSSLALLLSQMAAVAVFQTNVIVVGKMLGPRDAAVLDAVLKIMTFPMMAQAVVLAALWPAMAQATAQGDVQWVRLAYRRGLILTALLVAGTGLLCLVGGALTGLLLGTSTPAPNAVLLGGVAAFTACSLISALHAQCLNAAGYVRGAALLACAQATLNVILVTWGVASHGVSAVGWASTIAAVFTSVPGLLFLWNRRTHV